MNNNKQTVFNSQNIHSFAKSLHNMDYWRKLDRMTNLMRLLREDPDIYLTANLASDLKEEYETMDVSDEDILVLASLLTDACYELNDTAFDVYDYMDAMVHHVETPAPHIHVQMAMKDIDAWYELLHAMAQEKRAVYEEDSMPSPVSVTELLSEMRRLPLIIRLTADMKDDKDVRTIFDNAAQYAEYRLRGSFTEHNSQGCFIFTGSIRADDQEAVNKALRLTHHAEGFYENTGLEHVHVEVCVSDTWYGVSHEKNSSEPNPSKESSAPRPGSEGTDTSPAHPVCVPVTLIRPHHYKRDPDVNALYVILTTADDPADMENIIKRRVAAWLCTEAGMDANRNSVYQFRWHDLVENLPLPSFGIYSNLSDIGHTVVINPAASVMVAPDTTELLAPDNMEATVILHYGPNNDAVVANVTVDLWDNRVKFTDEDLDFLYRNNAHDATLIMDTLDIYGNPIHTEVPLDYNNDYQSIL